MKAARCAALLEDAMSINCQIDLSKFRQQAQKSVDAIRRTAHSAPQIAAVEGANEAKKVGPFQDRTGQLRGQIQAEPASTSQNSSTWEILSPMPYSIYVERGTRAHDIWPKAGYNLKGPVRNGQTRRAHGRGPHEHIVGRGIALRWVNGGKTFFAAHVRHPGSRAFPFMGPAYLKAERVLYRELERLVTELDRIWT